MRQDSVNIILCLWVQEKTKKFSKGWEKYMITTFGMNQSVSVPVVCDGTKSGRLWGLAPSSFEVKKAEGGFSGVVNNFLIQRANTSESSGHLWVHLGTILSNKIWKGTHACMCAYCVHHDAHWDAWEHCHADIAFLSDAQFSARGLLSLTFIIAAPRQMP